MKTTITTLVATLAAASTALAATGVHHDHSGFLVWAFLGLCALIVVAQLAPAAMLVVGMIKGLMAARAEAEVTTRP
ncbi:MAG: hypothetical protein HZB55_24255 [Deltaproteobacteria bacterium]|nr:hypothetical protein [Deltaproteobacteria bacterium]